MPRTDEELPFLEMRGIRKTFPAAEGLNSLLSAVTHPLIIETYPCLVTILVLVVTSRGALAKRVGTPAALLRPYSREMD